VPSTRNDRAPKGVCDPNAGVTITEMLVALMLLSIGALGIYQLFGTSAKVTAASSARVTAQQIATSEVDAIRSLPWEQLAMSSAPVVDSRFDPNPAVGPTAEGKVAPKATITRNGVDYGLLRRVSYLTVTGTTFVNTQAVKLVTVLVTWSDGAGQHDVRSSSAVAEAQTSA
jgi:prepilin-type N-terminal cleavage/methylation domain-containing protein